MTYALVIPGDFELVLGLIQGNGFGNYGHGLLNCLMASATFSAQAAYTPLADVLMFTLYYERQCANA
jgi:hypothetical protein